MPASRPDPATVTAVYAGRLRWLRARAGTDRGQAAVAAGLPVETYRGLETGTVDWGGITVLTAHVLLDSLGVEDERDLFGDPRGSHRTAQDPPLPRPRTHDDHPRLVLVR